MHSSKTCGTLLAALDANPSW